MWIVFGDQLGRWWDGTQVGTVLLVVAVLLGWGIVAGVGAATGGDAGVSNESTEEITLVTGDTVVVEEQGGETTYRVRGNTSAAVYETQTGAYVIPSDVNLTRFSKELFNVEVLRRQNQTDAQTASIPLIVQWTNETEMRRGVRSYARHGVTRDRLLEMLNGSAVTVDKNDATAVYRFLAGSDAVESVHYNARFSASAIDPRGNAEVDLARERFDVTGDGVTVAVLDSGINESHPDIGDDEVDEVNFVEGERGRDRHNHGTSVAGLITGDGTASNGTYVGVAPDADVLDIRVLDNSGGGSESRIIEGIEYAIQQDADVLSMSLGKPTGAIRKSDPFYQQIQRAASENITIVAAIGNEDPRHYTAMSPGTLDEPITVGASENGSRIWYNSRRGPTPVGQYVKPDLVAPGADVTAPSSDGRSYDADSGTSYATPLVSGAAALLAEKYPGWDRSRAKNVLTATADPIGPQNVYAQGSGNLNVSAALDPGIVVDPATIDFGFVPTDATETRTVTVRNLGNQTRRVNVSASATGIETEAPGTVSTNRSALTLAPGDVARLELTIDTTDAREEAYSGRLRVGDANAIFGYSPKRVVVVTKRGLGEFSTDRIRLVHRESGRQYAPNRTKWRVPTPDRSTVTAAFYVEDPGEYVAYSHRVHDGTPVVTVNDTTLRDGAASITLDESQTVSNTIATDSLPGATGDVQTQSLMATANLEGTPRKYDVPEAFPSPSSTEIRISPSDAVTYDVRRVLTASDAGPRFNSSAIYHLRHTIADPTDDEVVRLDRSTLNRQHVRYYRGFADEAYEATVGTPDFGETLIDSYVDNGVGDRFEQTIYVSESLTHYHDSFRYAGANWVASPQWEGGFVEFDDAGSITTAVKKHPFRSTVDTWSLTSSGFDATIFPTVGQPPNGYIVSDTPAERWTLWINGNRTRSNSEQGPIMQIDESHDDIESVRLQVQDRHEMSPLSNDTVTTFAATTNGSDHRPPAVPDITFESHSQTNVIPNGSVDLTVSTADREGTVQNVSLFVATRDGDGSPSSTPFENASGWQRVALEETTAGSYEATLELGAYRGTLSVALRAVDTTGNHVETTATDGVVVGSRTPTANLSVNRTLVEPGTPVRFDASGSYDDVGVVAYEWDLDGDGTVDETTSTPAVTHTYAESGTVRPTLSVRDRQGATNTTQSVAIAVSGDLPPRAGELDNRTTEDVRRAVVADRVGVAADRQTGTLDVAPESMHVARADVHGGVEADDGSTVVVSGARVNGKAEGHNVVGADARFNGDVEADGTVTVAGGTVRLRGGVEATETLRVLSDATLVVRGPVDTGTLQLGRNSSLEVQGAVDAKSVVGANGSTASIAGQVACEESTLAPDAAWTLRGPSDCADLVSDAGGQADGRSVDDRGADRSAEQRNDTELPTEQRGLPSGNPASAANGTRDSAENDSHDQPTAVNQSTADGDTTSTEASRDNGTATQIDRADAATGGNESAAGTTASSDLDGSAPTTTAEPTNTTVQPTTPSTTPEPTTEPGVQPGADTPSTDPSPDGNATNVSQG